ncbi:MAG TPA: hypothetical protein VH397_00085 [Xanthobacteraceae bacterium]|jgi:hypothetical protein
MAPIDEALQSGREHPSVRSGGDNAPQPVRSLRDWLDQLAERERLPILNPGMGLRHELAAVANASTGGVRPCFRRRASHDAMR